MPLLYYRDPADSVLKPYLAGLSTAESDARYMLKSGDTMAGVLRFNNASSAEVGRIEPSFFNTADLSIMAPKGIWATAQNGNHVVEANSGIVILAGDSVDVRDTGVFGTPIANFATAGHDMKGRTLSNVKTLTLGTVSGGEGIDIAGRALIRMPTGGTRDLILENLFSGTGVILRAPDGTGVKVTNVGLTVDRALTVGGTNTNVDMAPFARYSAAARAISLSVWTQFTAVSIVASANGTFSGGSNMTVPAPGYYVVSMKIMTSVNGRLIGATANSGDGQHAATANYHFDARAATASDWVGGTRIMWLDTYVSFWVYCTPAATCTLQAEVIRIGQ